jgi:hypothetical protein
MQENFKTMLSLSYLSHQVMQSKVPEKLKIEQLGPRAGRPVTVQISYEELEHIDKWDDSMFIFKKTEDDAVPFAACAFQQTQPAQRKAQEDKGLIECSICCRPGTLICCDDCPTAFHAECLGYTQSRPRGKWKCYFCKVTGHGIPNKVQRLAPN